MAYLNLNAGDEVGVARRTRYGLSSAAFGRVVKINGHGHIWVDTGKDLLVKFDKHGHSYKNLYGPSLVDAAQLRAELAHEAERKERARLARELEAELKSGWSYSGTFHATAERIAAMKNLLADLEKVAVGS